jgi:hypothetical protein
MMSEVEGGGRYHPSCRIFLSTLRAGLACGGAHTSGILCVCDARPHCGRLSYGLAICEWVYHQVGRYHHELGTRLSAMW